MLGHGREDFRDATPTNSLGRRALPILTLSDTTQPLWLEMQPIFTLLVISFLNTRCGVLRGCVPGEPRPISSILTCEAATRDNAFLSTIYLSSKSS
jgi:hypothetical protein